MRGTEISKSHSGIGKQSWRLSGALLLASTVLTVVVALPAHAQQAKTTTTAAAKTAGGNAVVLETIEVGTESPRGPDTGIVAKRSAAASKTKTPLIETPQAVNVVTRGQMDAQGVNSVAEALRYTPGVLPDPNGYDLRYDWLYIRGFNSYGTMWLDGLAVAGDPLNYATPSIHPYALERVEVIKGPASVLYGRAVPGGLVNQVSKRPQAETYREASVETSGFGGIQGAVDMTGALTEDGDWLYRFTGLAKNMNTQIDMERDRKIMLAPSLTWNPNDDTSLTLYAYYQRDRDIFSPRFYPAVGTLLPNPAGQIPREVFLGDTNAEEFNRDYGHIGYEFSHSFDETWTVRQNLRYGYAQQDMFLALVNPAFAYSGTPSSQLDRVSAVSDDWTSTFAVDSQAEASFQTGDFAHTALFGIDYVRGISDTNFGNTGWGVKVPGIDFLNPVYGLPIPMAPVTASAHQKQNQIGLYTQDQVHYGNWVGTFGLRYDFSDIETTNRITNAAMVETSDGKLTGRAGLTYLFDNGLAPYVSYSTAFLPLLGNDRFGNPFVAQNAEQYEIGIKYQPLDGRGLISLSLFDLTLDNALTPDPIDINPTRPTQFVQTSKQRVRGVEIEGKYELTSEFELLASYAYSNSEVLSSNNPVSVGREMLRLPEHQGSFWVNYSPTYAEGLSLSAGVRATSSYQADVTYLEKLRIPGRALVDIGAEFDFGALKKEFEGTRLRVNVTNLFDETYVSHCLNITGGSCNYGAGRAFTANLKTTW